MNKELKDLLDNYEKTIYGQAFPIVPSTHQLHLLLDYIANLDQQVKKQKENEELIDYLKEREIELKENVRIYEEKLRQTSRESFYYNSYLKTLHRYRAKRELIKEILHKVYADEILDKI